MGNATVALKEMGLVNAMLAGEVSIVIVVRKMATKIECRVESTSSTNIK